MALCYWNIYKAEHDLSSEQEPNPADLEPRTEYDKDMQFIVMVRLWMNSSCTLDLSLVAITCRYGRAVSICGHVSAPERILIPQTDKKNWRG